MIRRTAILLVVLSFTLSAQQKSSNKSTEPAGVIVHGDGFNGVIFPAEKRALDLSLGDKKMQYWTPSESDIVEAESKLVVFLQQVQLGSSEKNRILKDIKSYKRQYVGSVRNGEKELFVNFLCESFQSEWTRQLLKVFDGGPCFFHVQFSIRTKTFFGLQVNGYA